MNLIKIESWIHCELIRWICCEFAGLAALWNLSFDHRKLNSPSVILVIQASKFSKCLFSIYLAPSRPPTSVHVVSTEQTKIVLRWTVSLYFQFACISRKYGFLGAVFHQNRPLISILNSSIFFVMADSYSKVLS